MYSDSFVPKLLWSQLEINNLTLIFEAKGKSLDELFEEREKKFTHLCIFYLADKMVFPASCSQQNTHHYGIVDNSRAETAFSRSDSWQYQAIKIFSRPRGA